VEAEAGAGRGDWDRGNGHVLGLTAAERRRRRVRDAGSLLFISTHTAGLDRLRRQLWRDGKRRTSASSVGRSVGRSVSALLAQAE